VNNAATLHTYAVVLSYVHLRGADLSNAMFYDTCLFNTDLKDVILRSTKNLVDVTTGQFG